MYNDNREKLITTLEGALNPSNIHLNKTQRGRGMSKRHFYRCAALCIYSLSFGLPSTLSSDAHLQEGAYYEFDHRSGHSAEEQGINPTEAPPQPIFDEKFQDSMEFDEDAPERRDYFRNRVPRNQIPRNNLPRGTRERNQIQPNPIERNSIQRNPIPRNQIPRQSIERKQIKPSPMPRKRIPRTPLPRNQIPRETQR